MKTLTFKLLGISLLTLILFAQCNSPFYSKADYMKDFDELAHTVTTEYEDLSAKDVKKIKYELERLAHEDYERFRPEMNITEKAEVKIDQWTVQAFVTAYEFAQYMDDGTASSDR